jgi:hypothetical protein
VVLVAFYRGQGSAGVVMAGVNGFNAIEARARWGGALRRGNQGGRVTASTRCLQGAELGGGVVRGRQI